MNTNFRLFPESASTFSSRVDGIYAALIVVTVFFTLLIAGLIIYFSIRYRRRQNGAPVVIKGTIWLEVVWTVVPMLLTMVMFAWGASAFVDMRTMPPNALKIRVVGKQWMWKLQHPQGRAEINELHIPMNQPVVLTMISQDVIHSFYVPAFRVKQDVLPGYYSSLWFNATKLGRYHLFCAEYCGTNHSQMIGSVVVMTPEDYSEWLANGPTEPSQNEGAKLFQRFRCDNCHKVDESGDGPTLAGVAGSQVTLSGGTTVTAGDQYLRDSILNPSKQIVEGYDAMMPSYQGQISEAEVLQLIAYLESLKTTARQVPPAMPPE